MESQSKIICPQIIKRFLEFNETFNHNYSFINTLIRRETIDGLIDSIKQNSNNLSSLSFIKQDYLFDDIETHELIKYHITLSYNNEISSKKSPSTLTLKTPIEVDMETGKTLTFRPSNTPNKYFLSVNLKHNRELYEIYRTNDLHISIGHVYSEKILEKLNDDLRKMDHSSDIAKHISDINSDIMTYFASKEMKVEVHIY